jgi:tRNA pseudouridine55 synthase
MSVDYKKIPLVFNVYKPSGPSSFKMVYHFKKNLSYDFGKIGHFGTLDPFAEGVLLIGVQGAQRLNEYVHKLLPKTYRAVGVFGGKTESGDFTKPVIEKKDIDLKWQQMSKIELEEFIKTEFLGEYWQSPHSVSATKFEGKRLYQHALEGRMILKEKVKREILEFSITRYEYPEMEFVVKVSSGTYVRSLFEEFADLFGGLGALKVLERIGIGENTSANSIKEEQWPVKDQPFDLEKWGTPLDQVLRLNKVFMPHDQALKYLRGQRFLLGDIDERLDPLQGQVMAQDILWVYHAETLDLLGLGKKTETEFHVVFNLTRAISFYLESK